MNKYQVVMPNGDILGITADRMQNNDGDLAFFQGSTVVGEARYWQAWSLIGPTGVAQCGPKPTSPDRVEAGVAYVEQTIDHLTGRS